LDIASTLWPGLLSFMSDLWAAALELSTTDRWLLFPIFRILAFWFSPDQMYRRVQSLSVITTEKFCIILFWLAFGHFTSKWKYFFTGMILGFSSFKWCKGIFSLTCYHGEISGIRLTSPSVVTKHKNPDNNFKQNYWP
jgi:hypothetical protein